MLNMLLGNCHPLTMKCFWFSLLLIIKNETPCSHQTHCWSVILSSVYREFFLSALSFSGAVLLEYKTALLYWMIPNNNTTTKTGRKYSIFHVDLSECLDQKEKQYCEQTRKFIRGLVDCSVKTYNVFLCYFAKRKKNL